MWFWRGRKSVGQILCQKGILQIFVGENPATFNKKKKR
jgi:hypothetical protein